MKITRNTGPVKKMKQTNLEKFYEEHKRSAFPHLLPPKLPNDEIFDSAKLNSSSDKFSGSFTSKDLEKAYPLELNEEMESDSISKNSYLFRTNAIIPSYNFSPEIKNNSNPVTSFTKSLIQSNSSMENKMPETGESKSFFEPFNLKDLLCLFDLF